MQSICSWLVQQVRIEEKTRMNSVRMIFAWGSSSLLRLEPACKIATICYSNILNYTPTTAQQMSSVVAPILMMIRGLNVKKKKCYLCSCHPSIVAPTTMYLDVALETMPPVSLVVTKTPMTLITAETFITVITATPATSKVYRMFQTRQPKRDWLDTPNRSLWQLCNHNKYEITCKGIHHPG